MTRSVWLLNHYVPYPGEPTASRHPGLAGHLRELDWDVTLIASSVPLHDSSQQRLGKGEKYRIEVIDGQRYVWVKVPTYSSGAGRIVNMMAFARNSLKRAVTKPLDAPTLVVGSAVHLLTGLAAERLAKRHSVPFVFEVRDLWPLTLIERKAIRAKGPTARIMGALERHLYRRADEVVTLLPGSEEYIRQAGADPDRIHWIPNGVECLPIPEPSVQESRDLMYLGTHGISNDLDLLINGYADFRQAHPESTLRLRLIGDGPLKAEMQDLARRRNVPNISFEDAIPKSEVAAKASEALAFAFTMRSLDVYRYGISPNKVFDYMAAGKPVLMSTVTKQCPILRSGGGISITDNTVAGWAAAIAELDAMPASQLARLGKAGRAYVEENHDYRVLATKQIGRAHV